MRLAAADRQSVHGKAALLIVALDEHIGVEENFRRLDALSRANPDDALLLWMVAVQCRAYHWNQIGVEHYARLFKMVDPGPVLAHQTCANLLDDLHRYPEALVHRNKAIQLEPASWAYDGLGNTLTQMKRFDEADAAYAKSTSLNPTDPAYWRNWSFCKRDRGDLAAAAELAKKADSLERKQ